jgi:hypothetical protein
MASLSLLFTAVIEVLNHRGVATREVLPLGLQTGLAFVTAVMAMFLGWGGRSDEGYNRSLCEIGLVMGAIAFFGAAILIVDK